MLSFIDRLFEIIALVDDFCWSRVGWVLIIGAGAYLTYISRGAQFRALYNFRRNIGEIFSEAGNKGNRGIHPLKLYFASVGGMIGLGNIVTIGMAITVGGPGSIFWIIIASLCGMLIKYSEIYLGVKYRSRNKDGGYDGGPMYYLQAAFGTKFFAVLATVLICFYGVEIYNFLVIVDRIEHSFAIDRRVVVAGLLILIFYTVIGGINRLATVCTIIMPCFILSYLGIALYIIIDNIHALPGFFTLVVKGAFTGHAPIGGFIGSGMVLAAYLGMSKTVYSGDIGVGYDSIVQSETKIVDPKSQATLAIYALFTDTLICLITTTMLGVTGAWHSLNHLPPSDVVSAVIANYIPYSDVLITILLFFAGFTTIIAYLTAGTKCARFLSPKRGKIIYWLYAFGAFIFFSGYPQEKVVVLMSLTSAFLVILNVCGILKLRKDIEY